MKFLFSGAFNPRFEALPEWVAEGIRGAGHEVACFDHRSHSIPGRVRSAVRPLDLLDRVALNHRLLRAARRLKPDVVLVNQGSVISADTYRAIRRETGATTLNWWSDYPAEHEAGIALARSGACDLFYVSGTDAESRYHAAGAQATRWLPFGCDPKAHRPTRLTPEDVDRYRCRIAFVGSAYPERREVLSTVADLGLGVWGPGWDRYRSDTDLGPCIRGGALRPSEWTKVFTAADVVLNVSFGIGGDPAVYGTMANVRVFEALACGACQVVDAKRDVLTLFRNGVHLAAFRTADDLRGIVLALLDDPHRRAAMGRTGRREVLEGHTWRHRVERIVRDVEMLAPARAAGAER